MGSYRNVPCVNTKSWRMTVIVNGTHNNSIGFGIRMAQWN